MTAPDSNSPDADAPTEGIVLRYVVTDLVKTFTVVLAVVTLLLLFVYSMNETADRHLGMGFLTWMLPYVLPHAVRHAMQASVLFAVCNVYGRMSASNEIVALKSLGIHPLRPLWPAFAFGAALSLTCVALFDLGEGWGKQQMHRLVASRLDFVLRDKLESFGHVEFQDLSITVKDCIGGRLIRPNIVVDSPGGQVSISAQEAVLKLDSESMQLGFVLLDSTFEIEGRVRAEFPGSFTWSAPITGDRHDDRVTWSKVAQQRELVEQLQADSWEVTSDADLSPGEQRARMEKAHKQLRKLETRFHHKWANSFSCFFFVLVGVPLAVHLRTADFLTVFFIGFAPVVFLYNPMIRLGKSLAYNGTVPPQSVWMCNIVIGVCGLILLRRVLKH